MRRALILLSAAVACGIRWRQPAACKSLAVRNVSARMSHFRPGLIARNTSVQMRSASAEVSVNCPIASSICRRAPATI